MANAGLTVTVNHAIPNGGYSLSDGAAPDPTTTGPSTSSVAADIATLVADGATPTQAHVTALNGHWGTFLTAYNLYTAAVSADVTFFFNPSTVSSMGKLRAALRKIEHLMAGRIGE